jgi:[NiFe] hydrogenase large subunit
MPKKPRPNPPPPPPPPPPAGNRIVIDPITRIEGHLRIEVEVSNGRVTNAWSSGTLFRGVETILRGRRPEDAQHFTQRLCGVCTYVHASTSVRCVEDALSLQIPDNARVIRNLLMGAQFLQDHIVHFYHLHALDWVDVVNALSADPKATETLAQQVSPGVKYIDFGAVQTKLQGLASSGQLGPFAGGYWGHPAYHLSAEGNLLMAAHYLEALRQQVRTARMHAIFGGKNPHPQSLMVGGVTCRYDLTPARVAEFRSLLDETKQFIDTIYVPDVIHLAKKYTDWQTLGGSENFLAFGEFPEGMQEPDTLFFPRGALMGATWQPGVDLSGITEHVTHSWYTGTGSLNPSVGVTEPAYTGLDTADRYSWLKAPRYLDQPMEVGPLARMMVACNAGRGEALAAVSRFQNNSGVSVLNSVLGRTAARALETQLIADRMSAWLNQLNLSSSARRSWGMPLTQVSGVGLNEAPRGALGHWIRIQNGQIANYQMVVPSTWNFGPRCARGLPGPAEKALVGVPVADPARPLEVLRAVHSFDPCIACAVHVIDTRHDKVYTVRVL